MYPYSIFISAIVVFIEDKSDSLRPFEAPNSDKHTQSGRQAAIHQFVYYPHF